MAAEVQPTCPLCRADIHSRDLVVGVNAAVPTHQDDAMLASLQEQASSSDSKLQALLHQVLCCRPGSSTTCHHQSSVLCCVVACCALLWHAVLCCGMLCYAIWATHSRTWLLIKLTPKGVAFPPSFSCYAMLWHAVLSRSVLWHAVLCRAVLCSAVLCCCLRHGFWVAVSAIIISCMALSR